MDAKHGETETFYRKVQAVQMAAILRSARVSRKDRVRTVKRIIGFDGSIMDDIERKQLIW